MLIDRIIDPDHLPPLCLVQGAIASGHPLRGAVIALGNFDGFHRGHRHLITRAQQIAAGRHPVAVMSVEPHPRAFFDTPGMGRLALPAQKHLQGRMLGLDYIYEPRFDQGFAALSPAAFVEDVLHARLGVRHLVVGQDFRFGAGRRGDIRMLATLAAGFGIGVEAVRLIGDFSSTGIRTALAKGEIRSAAQALGRFWEAALTDTAAGPAWPKGWSGPRRAAMRWPIPPLASRSRQGWMPEVTCMACPTGCPAWSFLI